MGTHRCGRVVRFSRGLFEFLVRTLALLVAIHWGSETLVMQLGAGAHGNNIFNAHGHTTPLASCILEQADCTALELLKLNGYLSFHGISAAARDWGLIKHMPPAAVLHPDSAHDIAELIRVVASSSSNLTVAAKGPGHSVNGQAQADKGVVIEMSTMRGIQVMPHGDEDCALPFVEANGGELWVDVLEETLKKGLAPNSWTDYLYLSVGGTLSNAGVSGQTFRHGPQISNILQLEVVTGKGEIVICSASKQPELFHAVLGGLGQFGIITKARILLEPAPQNVRWTRAMYSDFEVFRKDQEMLISSSATTTSMPVDQQEQLHMTFDFIEGFVVMNTEDPINGWKSVPFSPDQMTASMLPPDAGSVLYYLEITVGYNLEEVGPALEERVEKMLAPLSYIPSLMFTTDVSYFKFLNRVHDLELNLRAQELWDVPHPWLNLFVPASSITTFDSLVFKQLVPVEYGGPILVYPVNRNKWDSRAATVVPDEEVFYLVAFLRNALPSGPGLESMLDDNARILKICEELRGKQYLPRYTEEEQWKRHFGADRWNAFVQHKHMFDPHAILAPGQNIFPRRQADDRLLQLASS
jgi:cytokinin dehydrogenase